MKTEPKIGETWYFLIGNAVACSKGKIIDITPGTVTFGREESYLSYDPPVYARSKIQFIERICNVTSESSKLCGND